MRDPGDNDFMRRGVFGISTTTGFLVALSVLITVFPAFTVISVKFEYWMHVIIVGVYYLILAQSWNLISGYAGQFSLAQPALSAIGAYTVGLLGKHLGVPGPFGIVLGICAGALASFAIGIISLRLGKLYFALTTFGLMLVLNWLLVVPYWITGGSTGLVVESLFPAELIRPRFGYYYLFMLLFLVTMIIIYKLVHSQIGQYLTSIREDENAAQMLGVNTVKWKVFAFTISGAIAGLAGGVYSGYAYFITPEMTRMAPLVKMMSMAIFGGIGTFWGPLIGGSILHFFSQYTRQLGEFDLIVYALVMIFTMRFNKRGLYPYLKNLLRKPH